jgi:hypothetical protein
MTSRARLFSIVAVMAYTAAYYFNWPQLRYYVGAGFDLTSPPPGGKIIFWYGWLGAAILAGAAAAFLTPEKLRRRLPADLGWMVPIAMVIAAILYEKRWFF